MISILISAIIIISIIAGVLWYLRGDRRKLRYAAFVSIIVTGLAIGTYSSSSHPVLEKSIQLLSQDQRIIEIIGQPISSEFFSIDAKYNDSFGKFKYSIQGPKGSGTVSVYAEMVGNDWVYRNFKVITAGAEIDLLK